jgi:hypothetical protein
MAQAPAQVVVPQPVPVLTLAQNKTYADFYNDTTTDEFQGAYGPVMAIFNSPGDPGITPAAIRDLVSNDPQNSSMGYLVLVIPALPDGIVDSMYCILRLRGTPVAAMSLPYSPILWTGELKIS